VGLGLTCLLAFAALCALVGGSVLVHPGRASVGVSPSSDYQVMTWSLRWWPWAIAHGTNPLHTGLFWPPLGFSTLWMTTIPVLSLVALPLTLAAGPLVAYNVLMLAAVPLAAGGAYLLCRELTGRLLPSVLGGLLFGLSPYMLGHMLSDHLDLVFVFPLPLLALLVVRRVRGKTSERRFVAGFAVLLLVLLGVSFELFLDLAVLVAIGSVIAYAGAGQDRRRAGRTIGLVLLAYVVCLPVLAAVAGVAFTAAHAPLRYAPSGFAIDLVNVVLPTPTVLAGRSHWLRRISEHFVSNIGERDGYLGLPLLLVAALAVRAYWRRGGWLIGALGAAALLLSLGPILTVRGRPVFAFPFALSHLPVLSSALPARMSVFAALAAACLCALWLSQPGRRALRALVAAVVIVSLLPNFWAGSRLPGAWSISEAFGWSTGHVSNGFVAGNRWQRTIRPGSTVLVLPTGDRTAASYWQAETGMRFKLAVPATPFVPPRLGASPFDAGLVANVLPLDTAPALMAARLRSFLIADHVSDVVVSPSAGLRWQRLAQAATATRPREVATMAAFPVEPALGPLRLRSKPLVLHASRTRAGRRTELELWTTYDGTRGHLHALVRVHGAPGRQAVLSSATGDVFFPAGSITSGGRAAVCFVELLHAKALLRLATGKAGTWKLVTLARNSQPIWTPTVKLLRDGTAVVAWIAENDPTRTLHAAIQTPQGKLRLTTLDTAASVASVVLAPAGERAVAAWSDAVAGEKRIRASILEHGAWKTPTTVASSLDPLAYARLTAAGALLRWIDTSNSAHPKGFEAHRLGDRWNQPRVIPVPPPKKK
jgi:hypothetical protein